jgi:hypothetical protein
MALKYDLKKDFESGEIEVYSPNDINDRFKSYSHLEGTARLHGFNVLEAANSMMNMYRLNYCNKGRESDRKKPFEVVEKWQKYYLVMKDKKTHKCNECGWKGKIKDMGEGISHEYSCPECNEDFDLSK